MTHTPKPWDTSREAVPPGHTQITVYAEATGNRIATVFENPADAVLIASAPDMLEALNSVKSWMEDCLMDKQVKGLPSRDQYNIVRDAIIKAVAQ